MIISWKRVLANEVALLVNLSSETLAFSNNAVMELLSIPCGILYFCFILQWECFSCMFLFFNLWNLVGKKLLLYLVYVDIWKFTQDTCEMFVLGDSFLLHCFLVIGVIVMGAFSVKNLVSG
ncbi:hypothetical protein SAY87_028500 [Trapa incisa]|uniref:Uncharacterized protein n=2 Tax=Trapa TaxID=22665 RepID=A0AAN7LRP4_TRANT|nr:hypothetical protein SAY87_028500 [Trapa incisa]KAK4790374.1 hypothetical protein SAY86_017678 [Trapa natans]